MHTTVTRHVRSSLMLIAMAATLTLVACASVAAGAPTNGSTSATPPTPIGTDPINVDPGTGLPGTIGPGAGFPGTGVPGTEPGGSGSGQPGDPGDPNGPVTGTPGPYEPIPGDGATHVTPVPGVRDPQAAAIDHISVAPDGVTLTVYWYGGVDTCYGLASITAVRGSDGVLVITVLEGTRGDLPMNTACIDLAQLKAATITLDQPLYRDGSQTAQPGVPR